MVEESSQNEGSSKSSWQYSIFKEALSTLTLTILSGATLAYILSSLFIKSYLRTIGFENLTYQALVDESNISAFTLGIGIIIFSFIFTIAFPSIVLRNLYHEFRINFQRFHDNHKIEMSFWLSYALFIPPLALLIMLQNNYPYWTYFIVVGIIPFFLLLRLVKFNTYNGIASFFSQSTFKLIGSIFVLYTILTISFFPFYLLIQSINNLHISTSASLAILILIWLFYSTLYGFRIPDNQPIQYFIDLAIAIILLNFTLMYSFNTIQLPIASFVGIKDKTAKIYKISGKDFDKIQKNITSFWDLASNSKQCLKATVDQPCILRSAKNKLTNDVYLLAEVAYRSEKNVILCPSLLESDKKDINYQCFITEAEKIVPTSLDSKKIDNNPLFIDKVWTKVTTK